MAIRRVARTIAASIGAVACVGTISIFALGGVAAAGTGVGASGNTVTNAITPISPDPTSGQAVTPGPFSSGQQVEVSIPANSVLTPGGGVSVVECSAPGGAPPTSPSQCDGNTLTSIGDANADGSISYGGAGFGDPIYALPDGNFGEHNTPVVCNLSNPCVLEITQGVTSFTSPHFFSAAFFVNPGDGTDDGLDPGTGTPETPFAVGLPLAALGVFGGALMIRRRRAARGRAA
jgi:hypothetical protein